MKKYVLFIYIVCATLLISSCASADDLKTSPTTLHIDGSAFSLDASVWRDFMPPAPSDGKPMASKVKLNLISGPDILSNIHLVRQYVIYGNDVWAADLFNIGINGSYIEGLSTNGPKWGPDVDVDVVLEFTYNGHSYKIQAQHQHIDKVQ